MVNFIIYDITGWARKKYRAHIAQYLRNNMRKVFLENSCPKCAGEGTPRTFYKKSKLIKPLYQQSELLL